MKLKYLPFCLAEAVLDIIVDLNVVARSIQDLGRSNIAVRHSAVLSISGPYNTKGEKCLPHNERVRVELDIMAGAGAVPNRRLQGRSRL